MDKPQPNCSLKPAELDLVSTGYLDAAEFYQATYHMAGDAAQISLQGAKPALAQQLQAMVEREGRCCPFLAFAITETETGYAVQLTGEGVDASRLQQAVAVLFPTARVVP